MSISRLKYCLIGVAIVVEFLFLTADNTPLVQNNVFTIYKSWSWSRVPSDMEPTSLHDAVLLPTPIKKEN